MRNQFSVITAEVNIMLENKKPKNRKIARSYYRRQVKKGLCYQPGDHRIIRNNIG